MDAKTMNESLLRKKISTVSKYHPTKGVYKGEKIP